MNEKIKILTLSDHPLMTSGVGTQTKVFIESMLKTGKYEFVSLAGAVKHSSMQPTITKEWEQTWKIFPVENFGNKDIVRSHMHSFKPDIVWIMTDPRFWTWLWEIEEEIRTNCSLVYYHVWDNFPAPKFNKKYYDSNDFIATISKTTSEIVREISPTVAEEYIPHAVDQSIFKKASLESIERFKKNNFGTTDIDYFFWNNRNARRKQTGTLAFWFNEYCENNPDKNIKLVMHTNPKDSYGTDLECVIETIGAQDRIILSTDKISQENLAQLYSGATATINISDAEGFGLSTLESMSCETPIIVNLTGGLKDQICDDSDCFGISIEPCSKAIIGSQQVPYIYEDRISKEDFFAALDTWLDKPKEERREVGKKARRHVLKNFNVNENAKKWDEILTSLYENNGSWETRKNYKSWELIEL